MKQTNAATLNIIAILLRIVICVIYTQLMNLNHYLATMSSTRHKQKVAEKFTTRKHSNILPIEAYLCVGEVSLLTFSNFKFSLRASKQYHSRSSISEKKCYCFFHTGQKRKEKN
jgi:hypothetical protein